MDSIEELFSKKYRIDSEEIKEKDYCSKHKNEEKTLYCKKCEKYVCPKCNKTYLTSLEPFINRYSNYSHDICEKGLNYDYIAYLSYDKKREFDKF